MEKLMNRIVGKPNLLEDEKLNAKIERFFENQTFQKMVENTDVFQDISNLSFANSIMQKNQNVNSQIISSFLTKKMIYNKKKIAYVNQATCAGT
jgi:hypothetical protein